MVLASEDGGWVCDSVGDYGYTCYGRAVCRAKTSRAYRGWVLAGPDFRPVQTAREALIVLSRRQLLAALKEAGR